MVIMSADDSPLNFDICHNTEKKMSGMFTIEKMFKRNLRPRRGLV